MEGTKILTLMLEARREVYQFIDSQYKPMPKMADGSIDEYAKGLGNNDIDALRHAYVSGRYTMEFGEETADILGGKVIRCFVKKKCASFLWPSQLRALSQVILIET
jgi:hypothetical protein